MAQEIARREPVNGGVHPLERIVDGWFTRDPFFSVLRGPALVDEGSLALDVSEDGEHVIVRASLPGFKREDVQVELDEGVLTISARREEAHEEHGEKFYRKERREGSVSRRIAMPTAVDDERAAAELADGVLTLKLPKIEKARRRQIRIG